MSYNKYGGLPYQVAILHICGQRIKFLFPQEQPLYLLGYLVAARPDGWAETGVDISWPAAKLFAHRVNSRSSDAPSSTTPSCMRHAYRALYRIIEHQGNAVGRGDGERHATLPGNDRVGFTSWLRRPD